MINELSKRIKPILDVDDNVLSWLFGVELQCDECELSTYTEESFEVEGSVHIDEWTKADIDAVFDSSGIVAKCQKKLDIIKAKKPSTFDYNELT